MPAGKIVIHEDLCKGCGLCINFCPQKILGVAKHLNAKGYYPATCIDEAKCTGCAICATMCPDVAIEVYREQPAKGSGGSADGGKTENNNIHCFQEGFYDR